jgi:hypothetical protein|tara:strand:- start:529 stop:639 length:111 start_codon:yes stop_codon:yes gene_type:complete
MDNVLLNVLSVARIIFTDLEGDTEYLIALAGPMDMK